MEANVVATVRRLTEENIVLRQTVQNLEVLMKQSVKTMESSLKAAVEGLTEDMIVLTNMFQKDKEVVNADLTLLKRSLVREASGEGTRNIVKLPEPKCFEGKQNSKELENFLLGVDQYFVAIKVQDVEKVRVAATYLSGDAKYGGVPECMSRRQLGVVL